MNSIEDIDDQAFVGLENLEELNLSNNELNNKINSSSFVCLGRLKNLNLKFNS